MIMVVDHNVKRSTKQLVMVNLWPPLFHVQRITRRSHFNARIFRFHIFPFLAKNRIVILTVVRYREVVAVNQRPFTINKRRPFATRFLFRRREQVSRSPQAHFRQNARINAPIIFRLQYRYLCIRCPNEDRGPYKLGSIITLSITR